jgi:hypothetical protein
MKSFNAHLTIELNAIELKLYKQSFNSNQYSKDHLNNQDLISH